MTMVKAFLATTAVMLVLRISIGVLLLTAQQEVDTVAYKLFLVGAGIWFIAYGITRATKMLILLDKIRNSK